ncbi:DUF3006 family protein [Salinigranum marinum]|uniref:DUF3006 family protein n=1 Tax=Salinigranum marinum TaxID=1515595 RepID=UPI002989AAF4|nr:DUF3006 family protein [Salinigranum marinum]
MLDPGAYTATLDRFEETPAGELAVLVVERDDDPLTQLDLPVETIPAAGRQVDAVFDVVVEDQRFELSYRTDETARRAADARTRFDRLARRPPSTEE